MKLEWYCGMYKTPTSLIEEPDECSASGDLEVSPQDWANKDVHTHCPECGSLLHQSNDHFTLTEEARKFLTNQSFTNHSPSLSHSHKRCERCGLYVMIEHDERKCAVCRKEEKILKEGSNE